MVDRDWDITHQKMIHWMIQWVNHEQDLWPTMMTATGNDKLLCDVNDRQNSWSEYWANGGLVRHITALSIWDVVLFTYFNGVTVQHLLSPMGVWSQRCYSKCYKDMYWFQTVSVALHAHLFCTVHWGYLRRIDVGLIQIARYIKAKNMPRLLGRSYAKTKNALIQENQTTCHNKTTYEINHTSLNLFQKSGATQLWMGK